MSVVGVDGCRGGWVAVAVSDDGAIQGHHLAAIDELAAAVPAAEIVAVDIPIGLPECGRRAADVEAHRFLGPRRSSLFFTPVRSVVEAADYATASERAAIAGGGGISRQAFGLAPKILDVERWLPSAPCPVYEAHPETSFAVLLGQPAAAPKKTWAGMVQRRETLARAGFDLDHLEGDTGAAGVDDVLDAAVAAWTARRILTGEARSFPGPPELGPDGQQPAIWA